VAAAYLMSTNNPNWGLASVVKRGSGEGDAQIDGGSEEQEMTSAGTCAFDHRGTEARAIRIRPTSFLQLIPLFITVLIIFTQSEV